MNKSVATLNAPKFINLTPLDINPLMSKCEIKVLYVGENRNRSFITEDVATEMAKTLRGAPIVGYYKEEKQDFADHGEVVIIDDEGIKFKCNTKPYGFVSPDAQVWFQEFEDTNDFGETIVREYLMTTGYLWTGQFEECKSAVECDGKPQSMELDKDTVQGRWERNTKGMDFFIINDAIFSKLCILGEDVEPCFEGASVTAPNVSASFAKVDDTFKHTLFSMMQDLKTALEGGQQMDDNKTVVVDEQNPAPAVEEPAVEVPAVEPETPVVEEPVQPTEEPAAASENPEVDPTPEVAPEAEFKKNEDKDDNDDKDNKGEGDPAKDDDEEDENKKKYTLLESQYAELQSNYTTLNEAYEQLQSEYETLKTSHNELAEFKRQSDDAKKDQVIESFYMLSEEDKQEVVSNKANYTLEEIEEKLSVICFRKGKFDSNDTSKNDNKTETPVTTFSFEGTSGGSNKPAWLSAVDNFKNNKN